jgi:DNA-binding NtrC family response regulator
MRKVLIVDDDDYSLFLVGQLLEDKGIDFEIAGSAAQALEHLARNQFDLVISDLNMPDESGFDLFRCVSSQYPGIRFAIMTGCGDTRTKSEAHRMGIDAYIEKPFTLEDLLQIVKNLALEPAIFV